jgi:hypothetical protein
VSKRSDGDNEDENDDEKEGEGRTCPTSKENVSKNVGSPLEQLSSWTLLLLLQAKPRPRADR